MKELYRNRLLAMIASSLPEKQARALYTAVLKLNHDLVENERLLQKDSGTTMSPNAVLLRVLDILGDEKIKEKLS